MRKKFSEQGIVDITCIGVCSERLYIPGPLLFVGKPFSVAADPFRRIQTTPWNYGHPPAYVVAHSTGNNLLLRCWSRCSSPVLVDLLEYHIRSHAETDPPTYSIRDPVCCYSGRAVRIQSLRSDHGQDPTVVDIPRPLRAEVHLALDECASRAVRTPSHTRREPPAPSVRTTPPRNHSESLPSSSTLGCKPIIGDCSSRWS